ncbi:glycosyl hydrolase-related protein, partial [Gemmatimonadota bacterium]
TNTMDKELVLDPEGAFFRFPFALRKPEVRIDVPWGSFRPETDQLPGASKNYFSVQRWVDLHDAGGGVTLTSLDAPLVQLGEIRTDAIVTGWLTRAEPSGTFLSYVMNNYWETNYRAGQDGVHRFRYSLQPHGGFDEARAERFALERAQPLVVVPVTAETPAVDFPFGIHAGRVVVTALKPAADSEGFVARLYNPGTEEDEVRIEGKRGRAFRVYRSDLNEGLLEALEGPLVLGPYEIVTLRVLPRTRP